MSSAEAETLSAPVAAAIAADPDRPAVTVDPDGTAITVTGRRYCWTYQPGTDRICVLDASGRRIFDAPGRPVVRLAPPPTGGPQQRSRATGAAAGGTAESRPQVRLETQPPAVTLTYPDTGSGALTLHWTFEADRMWLAPLQFADASGRYVVDVHYFAAATEDDTGEPAPELCTDYLVQPGRSGSPLLGAVMQMSVRLATDTWIGRGACVTSERLSQQWALPSHFLCAFSFHGHPLRAGAISRHLSQSVCLGLSSIAAADVRVRTASGRASVVFDVRSDLWRHLDSEAGIELGAGWCLTVADDYRDAIADYYRAIDRQVVTDRRAPSERTASVLGMSEFNPWGAQHASDATCERLTEPALRRIYQGLRQSGLRPDMYVVDDMWEEHYGELIASPNRLPHFDEFVAELRADGLELGMWAAFLRCSDPALLGLTPTQLLRDRAGEPWKVPWGSGFHYLLDLSQPAVAAVLTDRIAAFVRRYRPALIKFDFGYELPTIAQAMPADPAWAGEQFLHRSLGVITTALRAADPDIVLMYYSLSPLYADLVDVHSTDDMWAGGRRVSVRSEQAAVLRLAPGGDRCPQLRFRRLRLARHGTGLVRLRCQRTARLPGQLHRRPRGQCIDSAPSREVQRHRTAAPAPAAGRDQHHRRAMDRRVDRSAYPVMGPPGGRSAHPARAAAAPGRRRSLGGAPPQREGERQQHRSGVARHGRRC